MHPRETNRNQQKTCRKKNDDPRQHRKPNARPCISRRSRGFPCANTLRNECVDETDGANKECDDRPRPDATVALRCKFKRSKLRDHDAVHELHQRVTGHRDDRRPCKRPDFARRANCSLDFMNWHERSFSVDDFGEKSLQSQVDRHHIALA